MKSNIGYGASVSISAAGTVFAPLSAASTSVTEANRQMIMRESGTLSRLIIKVVTNTITASSTATIRKNSADTSVTVTVPDSTTGFFEDTTNSVTVADGDTIGVKYVGGASGTSMSVQSVGAQYEPDTTGNTITYLTHVSISFSAASATRYMHPVASTLQNTEPVCECKVSDSYTLSHLTVYVSSNARTTDTTVSSRKNAAAGAMSVTYTSGQTGRKTDTSNTDSLSSGDTFNYSAVNGTGTGSIAFQTIGSRLVNTSANKFQYVNTINGSVATNLTRYAWLSSLGGVGTTESDREFRPAFDHTIANLRTYVLANTYTDNTTIKLRENSADSGVGVTYGSSQTGWKEDLTNTFAVTGASDVLTVQVVTPNVAGSITIQNVSCEGYTADSFIPRVIFM